MVSWQYENFSSAELISPPVSPSPPSPSLYNGVPLTSGLALGKPCDNSGRKPISARAQLASSILNDLERQEAINDFGLNWNEESVNLNLFEELEEIEYTPPASPKKSLAAAQSSLGLQLDEPLHALNDTASESSADISALTAEFQAILDSLPKDGDNTEALSQVLEIAGIPTTIVDGEALVPVELDLSTLTEPDLQSLEMEVDDYNVVSDNDSDVIDESELYGMSDLSNHGSPASSVHSHSQYQLMDENEMMDEHSQAAQKILDALLHGDVATAETFLPSIADGEESDSSVASVEDAYLSPPPGPSRAVERAPKPERRGRKPGKKNAKGPAQIKDKAQRKKEQNKTAATRYRQKKKMEFALILEQEAELQSQHDELEKKQDDLRREILMVKQLLRDVIQSKKPQAKPIVQGRGLQTTASSLIGRNRRK